MPMKRKNLQPLNLNLSKNKFSERESGSLCGREKDFSRHIFSRHIYEKTNPMTDVFLSWDFCFPVQETSRLFYVRYSYLSFFAADGACELV